MSKQDFLSNLRSVGHRSPVHRVFPSDRAGGIEPRMFEDRATDASLWLNPDRLSAFRAEDFPELGEEERRELEGWVRRFREVADSAIPGRPIPAAEALDAYLSLLRISKRLRRHSPMGDETLRIYETLEEIAYPDFVRFLDFEVGDDSTGDPAVWIWVIVDDKVTSRKAHAKAFSEIDRKIQDAISRVGIERWPYIRYRTVSEQLELSSQSVQ